MTQVFFTGQMTFVSPNQQSTALTLEMFLHIKMLTREFLIFKRFSSKKCIKLSLWYGY